MDLNEIKTDASVDVSGLQCPIRGLTPARALASMEPGQILEIKSTDTGLEDIMPILAKQTGNELLGSKEKDGLQRFYVKKAKPLLSI